MTSRASIAGTRRHADERGRLRVHVLRFCRARGDEIDASRWRRSAENPEQRTRRRDYCPTARRRARLKSSYGMSLRDYDMLLEHQRGVCAICRTRPARTLCVDHCHVTG